MDAAGLVMDWNPQAERSFGWTREEAIGRELASLIIPEGLRDAHREGLDRFLATGKGTVLGERIELVAVDRDGREFPVELTISPLPTEEGYVFNAFVRDITERKRGEEAIEQSRDRALELSDAKSMFVASASHELRTPINGVIGVSQLLLDTELDDEQRHYADTIISSGEALVGIIENLLDFSKIEAGALDLDLSTVDLRALVKQACSMLEPEAARKGLAIVVELAPDLPASVHADGGRLGQVVANFLSNAVKFTAQGEVVLTMRSLGGDSAATLVRLEVSDSGIGIEQEALGRLFEPYSQADGSTTRLYGGTGLGLAISKQLIELMGGEIGAESTPGEGSTFWFEGRLAHAGPLGQGPEPDGVPDDPAAGSPGHRSSHVPVAADTRCVPARSSSRVPLGTDV
jgi:PAS domain S-box-containing protein